MNNINTKNTVIIQFFNGPMRTGKSHALIQIARESNVRAICLAPKMNSSQPVISSGGQQINAIPLTPFTLAVNPAENLVRTASELTKLMFSLPDNEKLILIIDECQFLAKSTIDAVLEVISRLSDYNKLEAVYIAGLISDVAGQRFPATDYLLSNLDEVEIVTPRAIKCAVCGDKTATHNMRLLSEVDSLVIISKDGYQSVCQECFSPTYIVNNIVWEDT